MSQGPGQPAKVSIPLARRIASKIRQGIPMADAAEQCGVDRSSLFNYLDRTGEPYDEFKGIIRDAVAAGKKPKQAG